MTVLIHTESIDAVVPPGRELRIAEVTKMDVRLDDGEFVEYRVRMNVSFKYED